jgi:hypothetical protein
VTSAGELLGDAGNVVAHLVRRFQGERCHLRDREPL